MLQDLQRSGRPTIIMNETVEAVKESNKRSYRRCITRLLKRISQGLPPSTLHTTLRKQLYLYVRVQQCSNHAESLNQKDY